MREILFPKFYGNEAVLETLRSGIASRRMAHAYLLEGPRGSGKRTLARLAAAAICCTDATQAPCGKCRACRTILATPIQSPDVHTLGFDEEETGNIPSNEGGADAKPTAKKPPKTKSIGVEAVRMLKEDVYMIPTELEKKIYIIAHAERMTVQAQNALLKILEEPPSSVVFFLLCEARNALLPTIRSRVQTLRMETFDDATLERLLLAHDTLARSIFERDETRFALAIRLSGGTYGGALTYLSQTKQALASDSVYEAHITAEACLSVVFSNAQGSGCALLGAELPVNLRPTKTALGLYLAGRVDTRERFAALLSALAAALRDIAVCMHVNEEATPTLLFFTHLEQPMALAARVSTSALFVGSRAISALLETAEANPNLGLSRDMLTVALLDLRLGAS